MRVDEREQKILTLEMPVFAEHVLQRGDDLTEIKIDKTALEKIAMRCNERAKKTGDLCPIVVGHSDEPGGQKEVRGWASNFRVSHLGDGRACIVALVQLEDAELLKKFPRRSPELWFNENGEPDYFDPICLLGSETPRLDLGLPHLALAYAKCKFRKASDAVKAVPVETYGKSTQPAKPRAWRELSPAEQRQRCREFFGGR